MSGTGLAAGQRNGHANMNFVTVQEYPEPKLESAWRDCLTRVECPAHYDAPEFFHEPYWAGQVPFAVLALEGERVTSVLTGLHQQGQVTCGLPSRPQICVDATCDQAAALDALARGLLVEAKSAGLVSVFTWAHLPLPGFTARGFRSRALTGNVVLDLTQGAETLFKQFPKDRRRNIRFAEKNGVDIAEATTDQDIADAFTVYQTWRNTDRKQIKGPGRSFEVFEKAARLRDNHLTLVARVDGKPIAMNMFRFFPGGLFESAANSSLDEFMHLKPNDLLQWRGIEWACAHGLRRQSLGGSHTFLRRFGGEVIPVCRYRLDRTFLRQHDMKDTLRDVGRETIKRMPDGIGKRVLSLLRHDSK